MSKRFTKILDSPTSQSNNYHITSRHGSVDTREFMILRIYKWEGIHKDIRDFVESCKYWTKAGRECVNTKNKATISNSPNEMWVCDLIGRIQDDNGGKKFIFMAIDHYTKWIEIRIIKNKTAKAVSEAIKE